MDQCSVGNWSATIPWTVSIGLLQLNDVSGMFLSLKEKKSPTEERLDRTSNELGPTLCCGIHMGSNKRWYPKDRLCFCFCECYLVIGKGKQFTKKRCFWPRPSVAVHSSCCPIGKSSGRSPKTSWRTLYHAQPISAIANSRSDFDDDNPIRSPAIPCRVYQLSALDKRSAVLAGRWCVTGEVVAQSLFHMSATVSFLTTVTFGKPSSRTNCAEDRPRFTHAFPRAWRWKSLSAVDLVWLVWSFLAWKLRPSLIKASQALA